MRRELSLLLALCLVGHCFGGQIDFEEKITEVEVEEDDDMFSLVDMTTTLILLGALQKMASCDVDPRAAKPASLLKKASCINQKIRALKALSTDPDRVPDEIDLDSILGIKEDFQESFDNVLNNKNINFAILSEDVKTIQGGKVRPVKNLGRGSFNDFFAAHGGVNVGVNSQGDGNQIATQTGTSGSSINQFQKFIERSSIGSNAAFNTGLKGVVINAINKGNNNALGIQQSSGGKVGGGSFNLISQTSLPEGRAARSGKKSGVGGLLGLVLNDLSLAGIANIPIKDVLNDNNINIPVLSSGVTTVQDVKRKFTPVSTDALVLSSLLRSGAGPATNTGFALGSKSPLGFSQLGGGFSISADQRSNPFQQLALMNAIKKSGGFPNQKFFGFNNNLGSSFGGTNLATNNVGNNNQLASQLHTSNSHISQGSFFKPF